MAGSDEPLRDIAHLGHIELLTPKLAESLRFFTELLGMDTVHREGGSSYLRTYGDFAAASFKLTEAAAPGLGHVGWRTVSEPALLRRAAAIEAAGLGLGWSNGDFVPVIWDEAERGTGVYWDGALPASFMHYATPDLASPADADLPEVDPL